VKRPVLRYHGGKFRLRSWIVGLMPEHKIYVEPYGGAGSILLAKERSFAEVYNDLDGGLVRLFRVLRHPLNAARLRYRLRWTPFARAEHEQAMAADLASIEDDIEVARLLIVRSFMSYGADGVRGTTSAGFRSKPCGDRKRVAHEWLNYHAAMEAFSARLQGVLIECRPALDVLRQQDSRQTLHYCDPPYLHQTRTRCSKVRGYSHEMSEAEHVELASVLRDLAGAVMISGYDHELYRELYDGWERFERPARGDGGVPRLEVLWRRGARSAGPESWKP
jgi:DNA adenine methylase